MTEQLARRHPHFDLVSEEIPRWLDAARRCCDELAANAVATGELPHGARGHGALVAQILAQCRVDPAAVNFDVTTKEFVDP
jgi:hypothetical protein